MDDLGFIPTGNTQAPVAQPQDPLGFTPSGGTTTPQKKSGGNMFASLGMGALNLVDNNPISHAITSLAAMPVQGLAKVLHQPDPYANGAMGKSAILPNGINITSSDQPLGKYLESEAGNAATVGSLLIPAGRIAGSAAPLLKPVLGRFAPSVARIGTQAAIGGFQGLAGGMQQGQSAEDLKGSAKFGAAFGGGLATAGELGSALLSSLAETTGTSRLQSHVDSGGAAKTLTKAFNDTSTATTNPIKTLEENQLVKDLKVSGSTVNVDGLTNPAGTGSLDNLIQAHQDAGTKAIEAMGNAGGPTVNPEDAGISLAKFKEQVLDSVRNNPSLRASGNVGKMSAEITRRFDDYAQSYGDTIPFKDVNAIRVAMNRVWDPETWDAEKAIGNAARGILYNAPSGGTALKSAMQSEQELINAKEFLQKLAGTKVVGGKFTKVIADSTAAAVGAGVGLPIPFVGPAVGAATSAYAMNKVINHLQTNYFDPTIGPIANNLKPFIPALSTAKTIGQGMAIPAAVQK